MANTKHTVVYLEKNVITTVKLLASESIEVNPEKKDLFWDRLDTDGLESEDAGGGCGGVTESYHKKVKYRKTKQIGNRVVKESYEQFSMIRRDKEKRQKCKNCKNE